MGEVKTHLSFDFILMIIDFFYEYFLAAWFPELTRMRFMLTTQDLVVGMVSSLLC